jgi:hypothetical protein
MTKNGKTIEANNIWSQAGRNWQLLPKRRIFKNK